MKISGLWRYPVKSMGGETLQSAQLDLWGVCGDRVWAVKEQGRDAILGAKKLPALMQCSARFSTEPSANNRSAPISISLPDGTALRGEDPALQASLGTLLGQPVELAPIVDPSGTEQFRRAPPPPGTDMTAYLREMFARTPDEPLPDLSVFPPEVMTYEAPPGTWFDALPILVMTTQTLAALSSARPESAFDVQRFRPNILIDAGGSGFVENQWVGRKLRVGSAVLAVDLACPRCIMTTHGFNDLPRDPKIMRTLVQQNGGNAGVYARVIEAGLVSSGDTCSLLP